MSSLPWSLNYQFLPLFFDFFAQKKSFGLISVVKMENEKDTALREIKAKTDLFHFYATFNQSQSSISFKGLFSLTTWIGP